MNFENTDMQYCRQTCCPIRKQCKRYLSENRYRKIKRGYMLPNPDGKVDCSSFLQKESLINEKAD